jgi:hypothetical protein
MSAGTAPVAPRLSATILILRDTLQGMEVLMVTRHREVDFLSGALVFPGGKLAKGDEDPRACARCWTVTAHTRGGRLRRHGVSALSIPGLDRPYR